MDDLNEASDRDCPGWKPRTEPSKVVAGPVPACGGTGGCATVGATQDGNRGLNQVVAGPVPACGEPLGNQWLRH